MPKLLNRVSRLEAAEPEQLYGAVVWMEDGETQQEAIARHKAKHCEFEGDVLFIELIGYEAGNDD